MNRSRKTEIIAHIALNIAVLCVLILTLSIVWVIKLYGTIGFEEVVFHLTEPMSGTSSDSLLDYVITVIVFSAVLFAIFLFLRYFPAKKTLTLKLKLFKRNFCADVFPLKLRNWLGLTLTAIWLITFCGLAQGVFGFFSYVKNSLTYSSFIEEHYVSPYSTEIIFPEKKRNLIYIYLESTETTLQDEENGGIKDVNLIPELTQIAKENISFSQNKALTGAKIAPSCSWTSAALLAQNSGVPLKTMSLNVLKNAASDSEFMPGASSIGEILQENGYKNYFMAGSDMTFGGRRKYFTQHGDYTVYDLLTARSDGLIAEDYYVWWGMEDELLYEYAKQKLTYISSVGEPFNFSILTVDTHFPDGYTCRLCPTDGADNYSNVWSCASKQLYSFLNWIKEQPFYENTTVIISGDHLSMDPDYFKGVDESERYVYNAIVNSAVDTEYCKDRKFTTLDMFPTALAALGAKIDGERLALGTNLFSGEKTLSEQYGYEEFFKQLERNSKFFNNNIMSVKK